MMIEMHQNAKIAAVWLTQREKEDPAVQQKLEALYADCKTKKYTVAVFLSGPRELTQQTSSLLCYNRRRAAQLAGRGL